MFCTSQTTSLLEMKAFEYWNKKDKEMTIKNWKKFSRQTDRRLKYYKVEEWRL